MTVSPLKAKFSSIEKIKAGGQKIVYKATYPNGEIVALKVISTANDPRVLQEISVVKSLSLPCVPQIIESGIVTDEAVNEDALYIIEQVH